MRRKSFLLLTFLVFACLAGSSQSCYAKDVGYRETATKAKSYAIATVPACDNAVFAGVYVTTGQCRAAATVEVASLTKTPTVEVKAKAAVEGQTYKRQRRTMQATALNRGYHRLCLYIDPGLRKC